MSIADKLIKKIKIENKKELDKLKVSKEKEKLDNLITNAEKKIFKKFFLKDFTKIGNYLIKGDNLNRYKLVIDFTRDCYEIDDEHYNNHRIGASVIYKHRDKLNKNSDIKRLKENLKEKKNFEIIIRNNADWKHLHAQSFAINETEKALKKIIFYFENGLYSWGNKD